MTTTSWHNVRKRLIQVHNTLVKENAIITSQRVKDAYLTKYVDVHTLVGEVKPLGNFCSQNNFPVVLSSSLNFSSCGGYATPATYEVDGKQYVVIAAGGGGRQRTKAGDYYIAFALPD